MIGASECNGQVGYCNALWRATNKYWYICWCHRHAHHYNRTTIIIIIYDDYCIDFLILFLWYPYDIMVFLWYAYDMLMLSLWYSYNIPMICLRYSLCLWYAYDFLILLGYESTCDYITWRHAWMEIESLSQPTSTHQAIWQVTWCIIACVISNWASECAKGKGSDANAHVFSGISISTFYLYNLSMIYSNLCLIYSI